ncbi:MAG TPA: glycoside hydrolase family 15 protein, partial [Humisphaera sp.]
MPSRIEDYAVIGDCHTVALVGKDGSIDWLCLPRFDSGACFAALLGTPEHGRWLLAPDELIKRVTRRYRPGTLVLETEFETVAGGAVTLVDFMTPRGDSADVVRIVVGTRGSVRMKTELTIRFDYGWVVPWVRRVGNGHGTADAGGAHVLRATAGPDTLYFTSAVPVHGEDMMTVGTFTVAEGQRVPFDLSWHPTHLPEPKPQDAGRALSDTMEFWEEWSARCTYDGPYRDAVCRSLITLKALTYAPTGGICAAATTSLPEHVGGVRNWDYRFCWLRDATFTLHALVSGGYTDEAAAWRQWLVNAVAGDPAGMQIMYGLAGERRLTELQLPWLPGYEGSRPV